MPTAKATLFYDEGGMTASLKSSHTGGVHVLMTDGAVRFKVTSLYPLLYRLEKRGWIQGRWVEKAGQRRCRYYRITKPGRTVLADQRKGWERFVAAINRIVEVRHA